MSKNIRTNILLPRTPLRQAFVLEVATVDDTTEGRTAAISPAGTVDIIVDWGDGNQDTYTTGGPKEHTYDSEGTYIITIRGVMTHYGGTPNDWIHPQDDKVIKCLDWNLPSLTSLRAAFSRCENLTDLPNYLPPTVTNLNRMLRTTPSLSSDITGWDTSNITDMAHLFAAHPTFNQDIGDWDTSSVTTMRFMFLAADVFDQNLNGWDVSNVTNMSGMFGTGGLTPVIYNQPMDNWDTSSVTNMQEMFRNNSEFNQDIGMWDTSSVTDMLAMFLDATSFNQDLSGWCVTNIPTEPTLFDDGATGWTLPNSRPIWGTCP